jgi:hypothetical protein
VSQHKKRTFTDSEAVRSRVPLMVGIVGPSGCGKTYSALRLATGIRKVFGGDIYVVDTESKRALHYADHFKFRHVPFGAPFSPSDYLDVLEYCAGKGASAVVVDSMSHEHEGPGGVLEWHALEVERLTKGDETKAHRLSSLAWSAPKQDRRRLINSILQLDLNVIFCFRAKDKIKPDGQGDIRQLGWMPIGGADYIYEMTVNFLLPPAANGVPTWRGLTREQEPFFKAPPKQFVELLADTRSLDETIGEGMAKWAAGNGEGNGARSAKTGKVDKAGADALVAELVEQGIETPRARSNWMKRILKRNVEDASELTASELSLCMQAAKESA